jgi:ABC-type multidrug transport system fused ATPase/permease subunit
MSLPPVYRGVRLRWLGLLIATGLAQANATILAALVMEHALDTALTGAGAVRPAATLGSLAFLGGLAGIARWVERHGAECLGQHYVHELRRRMFDELGARARDGSRPAGGAVSMRFVSDLNALRQWISLGQARLIVASSLLCAVVAYLATLDWRLSVVVCLILAVHAGVSVFLGDRLELAVTESRKRRSRLASFISEKADVMPSIISYGRLRGEQQRLERTGEELCRAMNRRAWWAGSLRAASEWSVRVAIAAVISISLLQLQTGRATPGQILAAVSVVALLVGPVRDIGRAYEYWKSAKISRQKLERFLSGSRRRPRRADPLVDAPRGEILLEGVSVREQDDPFHAAVTPGTRLAVLGANGAGKTTLLYALAGIRPPARGAIRLDGQPVQRIDRRALQDAVGIASADLPLLSGTVRRNVRYRLPATDEAALEPVCHAAGVAGTLGPWPGVLTRRVAQGGDNLSCGERARVQLARAILGNPPVLVLDELDSHLDEQGRSLLRELISGYRGTVIFSTHDPATAALADQTWLLAPEGIRVVESAPAEHLQPLTFARGS